MHKINRQLFVIHMIKSPIRVNIQNHQLYFLLCHINPFLQITVIYIPRPEADPGMEGMLIGRGKAGETPVDQKLEEPEEYDADEQVVGAVELKKQQQSKRAENIGM